MNRYRFTAAIGAAAMALALIGAGAAPAMASTPGPSTSITNSAAVGNALSLTTFPTNIDYGNVIPGGPASVVSSSFTLQSNLTSYTVTILPGTGDGTTLGMTDGSGDTILNKFQYFYPGATSTGPAWLDFGADMNVYGSDPAGPSANSTGSGPQGVTATGTFTGGTATVNGIWALRPPGTTKAGPYSELMTINISAN